MKIRHAHIVIIAVMTLSLLLTACAAAETPPPAPAAACPTAPLPAPADPAAVCPATSAPAACAAPVTQPALYGLWVKQQADQRLLLTISAKSVYLVEYDSTGDGYVRESYYTVQSVDWVNGVLETRLTWVRVNGRYGGFDSPAKWMKVFLDGDSLYYSIADEDLGAPAQADNGPWERQ